MIVKHPITPIGAIDGMLPSGILRLLNRIHRATRPWPAAKWRRLILRTAPLLVISLAKKLPDHGRLLLGTHAVVLAEVLFLFAATTTSPFRANA